MFNIKSFRDQVLEAKSKLTPEELRAPDKPQGGKFFNTPGVFEVEAGGYQPFAKKAGGEYFAIPVKSDDGKEEKVMINLTKWGTEEPNIFAMQMTLRSFGFAWSQVQIGSMWKTLVDNLPFLTVGRTYISVSFQGYCVDYLEKGVYGIRDFSKGAPAYPENVLIDNNNGDKLVFGSKEEAQAFMKEHSMKEGKKVIAFLKPSEGMKWTKEQKEIAEAMDLMLEEKKEEAVEAPKASTKPVWKPGQK
jgi:hypothetical protein